MDLNRLKEMPPWEWPEDTSKAFLEILLDSQADTTNRILAAELAGDFTVINDDLVDALLFIIGSENESEKLRGKAAIALGPVLDHADMDGFDDPDDVPISEDTFYNIQESLHRLYRDVTVPENVRRQILEASVRASQDWHEDAIQTAYSRDDEDWRLTAVFSMRWIRGFDNQILEALESNNPDIHYQAICAAGNWAVDAAWAYISRLVRTPVTDKPLLLAAIDAVVGIRPQEAGAILMDLTNSGDEEIVEAAHEAMAMAEVLSSDAFDESDA